MSVVYSAVGRLTMCVVGALVAAFFALWYYELRLRYWWRQRHESSGYSDFEVFVFREAPGFHVLTNLGEWGE